MGKVVTYEDVRNFFCNNDTNGCKLLSSTYESARNNMRFLCKCGKEFEVPFYRFKKGKMSCNSCAYERGASKTRLSYSHVKSFIEVESGSGCKLLSEKYINNSSNLKIKCKCGDVFFLPFSKFQERVKSRRCEVCRGTIDWDMCKIRAYVEKHSNCEIHSKQYTVSSGKLRFKCSCGNGFTTTWDNFLRSNKRTCDACGVRRRSEFFSTPKHQLLDELYSIHGDNYSIIGEYINKNTKTLVRHNKCGFEWMVELRNLIGNKSKKPTGCPSCSSSTGENKISRYLDKYKIPYEREYWFDDCRYIYPLPFDFYLPYTNQLIEYDGEGHYEVFRYSKNKSKMKDKLIDTQRNDKIKNEYCETKNLMLLRIPYWEFDNIDNILSNFLELNKNVTGGDAS